jgi:hypothetical protein
MLNSAFPTDFRWNRLQEPARPASKPADLMRLLSALDSGWQILGPVNVLRCFDPEDGLVYEIMLCNFITSEVRELHLACQESVENFLREENIAILPDKSAKI